MLFFPVEQGNLVLRRCRLVVDGLIGRPLDRLTQPLGLAAGELCLVAPFAGCRRRARRYAPFFGLRRSTEKIDQSLIRIPPITLLGAEAPRHDDDDAVGRHPPAGEQAQALNCPLVEARCTCGIEPKLDCRRDLVDVLSAGAAGASEEIGRAHV